ncbi:MULTISPECIES: hypothetical protein [Nitrospira]|uniref:Uncharacterized protein n=2 Tax=Nitrospira TaxID=1234 RepID=A0AA86MYV6_9BACT|nr:MULTISPECIES: hypothetical protein [Nitrospira]CAE6783673.1 hypothetical protein NSPZN2_50001 [Nitrospira defluvii]CAI4031616.1 hypothetical protein DNFV4_02035 [Nitrospira tepida]
MNHIDPQIEKHKFVFSAFREAHFSLSLQMKDEEYPKDGFADVKTIMRDDSVVEWQLGGWLDEDQMRVARKKERLETELRRVISRIPNTTVNFRLCLILPRDDAERFQKSEADALKSELQHLIQKTDSDWTAQPLLQSPQGQLCRDFTKYPRLERYLHSFLLMPRGAQDRPHQRWIEMEGWGGAYNPLTAVEALRKIVAKKAGRYGGLQGVDARLLLHYDEAILYNSPYQDSDTTLEDMAQLAGHWLSLDFPNLSATFREVYLLHTPERCAYQVFPAIFKCMGNNASPYE